MKFSHIESLMEYIGAMIITQGSFFLVFRNEDLGRITDCIPCSDCDSGFNCKLLLKETGQDLCLPRYIHENGYDIIDFTVSKIENTIYINLVKNKKSAFKLINTFTFK